MIKIIIIMMSNCRYEGKHESCGAALVDSAPIGKDLAITFCGALTSSVPFALILRYRDDDLIHVRLVGKGLDSVALLNPLRTEANLRGVLARKAAVRPVFKTLNQQQLNNMC